MTPDQYRTALATLGLSQQAAGRWLGVSPKTAQRYAITGPSGPAARAVGMAFEMTRVRRVMLWEATQMEREGRGGDWVRHSDLTAALDLP